MRGIPALAFICLALAPSDGMQSTEDFITCTGRVSDLSRIALDSWLSSPAARGRFTKDEVSSKVKEFAVANLSAEYPPEGLQSIEISST